MTELKNIELIESLATALEIMAFVAVAPAEEPFTTPDDAVSMKIEYRGEGRGSIELVAPRDLGRLLLDNTLSCDPSDTLVMPNPADALAELLNIVCGILLKRIGAESKYEMHVPSIVPFNGEDQSNAFAGQSGWDVVLADNFPVAIRLTEQA